MEKIKRLWQNEYFKTAISVLMIIVVFLVFWYGSIAYFNNESPYLVVSSGSMRPTLEVGDLIIVKWVDPSQINASYLSGDIIVFKSAGNPQKLIVHRAVSVELRNGVYWFTTHGDANPPAATETFSEKYYVGKVIARVPFIGHISLFTHTPEGFYFFIFITICLIIIFILLPSSENEKKEKTSENKKKGILYKILNFDFILSLILNVLIIAFMIFSLWGSLSFRQPGAEVGFQQVTIRGMYTDLQYHKSFSNVEDAFLSHGILTYTIDCEMKNGDIRTGVPTFSWAQFSIILLVAINVWTLTRFLLSKRAIKGKT